MNKTFIILAFICITAVCNSQDNNIQFLNLSTEDGLSASWVRSIYQDKYGFMWFGTSDGLNRYDAFDFKIFKPDDSPCTLINGAVNCIAEREDGLLWICTSHGVSILNVEELCFYPFPYLNNIRVNHVITDNDGLSWFSTYSGVFVYNSADSSIINYKNDPSDQNSLTLNQVRKCYQDNSDNIWIATEGGIDIFQPENYSFLRLSDTEEGGKINGSLGVDIIQDNRERIWLAYQDAGIEIALPDEASSKPLKIKHILDGLSSNLLIDNNNQLWIGNSSGNGIYLLDLNSIDIDNPEYIEIARNPANPEKRKSLIDKTISSMYKDRNGGVWIGSYAGGVSYYNSFMKQFNISHTQPGGIEELNDKVVNCFLKDNDFFWIGTESGLYRYTLSTRKLDLYRKSPHDPNSIGADGVLCLYKDGKNNLWIGTWNGGLNRYNYQTNNFKRYIADENKPGSLSNSNVFVIHEDKRENLWIGTNGGGLNIFDYKTETFRAFMPDNQKGNSIYHNAVNDICETSEGELYISVYHSVELFDYETETFTHYYFDENDPSSISSGRILDVFEDTRKNMWIATSTGLNLFNKKDKTFRRIGVKDGLPNNTVQAIVEDDHKNLWLSTNNGISKFLKAVEVPDSFIFQNYFVEDGLWNNEFVRRSVHKELDGLIYFGGTKGYTYFYPEYIYKNTTAPNIVLTDFRVFGAHSEKRVFDIDKDINLIEEIEIPYYHNDFTIRFAALNYLNPSKNQYRYILEGYENEWYYSGNKREATYTNIDPGKYVFRVFGSNNDGVWSEQEKILNISIRPPWWDTILFKILLIILLISASYTLYNLRINRYRKQRKILENMVLERTSELSELNTILEERQEEISIQNEELSKHRTNLEKLVKNRTKAMEVAMKKAEEADKLKSAFLANMSHEIRTPMNAIVGFSALINNEDISDEERKEFTEIIGNNCNTLMVLINDILDISLIEANQLKLKKQEFDVVKLFEELERFLNLNKNKSIKIEFIRNKADDELIMRNDAIRFRQVFTNLLNNAYKYTEEGQIQFGYNKVEGQLEFFVKDSGIGIDESEYQNIFNFFHKIDKGDNQFYRGAGIGLSISNKLVEMMGGKIWLKSSMGEGTTFYLRFPSPHLKTMTVPDTIIEGSLPESSILIKDHTIVVAEDDSNNYALIEKILQQTKAELIWAKNGREAVNYIKKNHHQKDCIVIMDIKMPIMNGIRASEKMKKINPEIPIIAVTAYAQAQNKTDILSQNFVDYIAKPLDSKELLETILKYTRK